MPITLEKLVKNWVLVVFFVAVGTNLAWAEFRFGSLENVVIKQAEVVEDISSINARLATNEVVGKLRERNISEAFERLEKQQDYFTEQMDQLIRLQLRNQSNQPLGPYGGR